MPLIYCVEDDESIRELVSYALRGQGVQGSKALVMPMRCMMRCRKIYLICCSLISCFRARMG